MRQVTLGYLPVTLPNLVTRFGSCRGIGTFSGVLLRKSRKTGRSAPLLVSEVRLCMAARDTRPFALDT